jgi:hypothetical protein
VPTPTSWCASTFCDALDARDARFAATLLVFSAAFSALALRVQRRAGLLFSSLPRGQLPFGLARRPSPVGVVFSDIRSPRARPPSACLLLLSQQLFFYLILLVIVFVAPSLLQHFLLD